MSIPWGHILRDLMRVRLSECRVLAIANDGSVWVPDSSFSDVFFYLAANRGNLRQVLVFLCDLYVN